ncbi:hypothetical protein V2J09_013189 [Rumex salicifolius]
MDIAELHGGMCKILSNVYCRVMNIFPALEAARPRSRSGIQALCSLHIALEKAKNILQHCSECSKLYLAITGDSVLLKFERAKCSLIESLKRVEDIVEQSMGCQILDIVSELQGIIFALDPLEKQVGDEIIALFQKGRRFDDNCTDNDELECFHQAASKLGINSSRAALTERRALKKLIDRARMEEDKRKESIVAYLLFLMRKYSKLFRSDLMDDNDSQGSTPCSPTVRASFEYSGGAVTNGQAFDRQFSKLCSFNLRPSLSFRPRSGQLPIPPEELRCPISLQLMYDPVIIASGQTYERVCIEKWFSDGHSTCPKTQQQLSHLCLTPNYCVKGLIASWCEQHGVPAPDGPPESLDLNYWRLAFCDSESGNTRLIDSSNSCNLKGVKVVPLEESGTVEEVEEVEGESGVTQDEGCDVDVFEKYNKFLDVLNGHNSLRKKCIVVEQLRRLLKDDEEARMFMGAHGFVEALMGFVKSAVHEKNELAQEVGAMALFNIAVNNNRNKELMLSGGITTLLEQMIPQPDSHALVAALYLNLSYLEGAKPALGSSSKAIPFLIRLLDGTYDPQARLDALHALFNVSMYPANIPHLLNSGIIPGLHSHLREPHDSAWTEKSIAVLINLASSNAGREGIISEQGLISELTALLDMGEPVEQEQAISCLLILSNGSDNCCQMLLQEGVIPSLVSLSVNGTTRSRDKSQKLLMLFRQQRQRDPSPPQSDQQLSPEVENVTLEQEPKSLVKSASTKKFGKALSFFRRNRKSLTRR